MEKRDGFWAPPVLDGNGNAVLRMYFPVTYMLDQRGRVEGYVLDDIAYAISTRSVDGVKVDVQVGVELLDEEVESGDMSTAMERIYSDKRLMRLIRVAGMENARYSSGSDA